MLVDMEIERVEEDVFYLSDNVKNFIDHYIYSDFSGSILLEGKWGIGKSSYLNLIKEKINTDKKIKPKYIDINFWIDPWSEKPFELLAMKVFPFVYYCIRFMPIILVLLLASIQFVISFFQKNDNTISSKDIVIWVVLVLSTSLLNLMITNFSKEMMLEKITKKWISKKSKEFKFIFILDDFDRIEDEDRKKIYSFMSKINSFENSVVIAVGEYNRIVKDNESSLFIQKILSNIEFMPLNNGSTHVWKDLENTLTEVIGDSNIAPADRELFTNIRDLFVDEKRTMREAKQLIELFKKKYFDSKVNSSEQLAICYVYQFYNREYTWLKDNLKIVYNRNLAPYRGAKLGLFNDKRNEPIFLDEEIQNDLNMTIDNKLSLFIYQVFHKNVDKDFVYPSITKQAYFSNYQIENIIITEVISIHDVNNIIFKHNSSSEKIKELIETDKLEGFYDLFRNHYLSNSVNSQMPKDNYLSLLKNVSILSVKEKVETNTMFGISYLETMIYRISDFLMENFAIENHDIFRSCIMDLDALDLSEKLYILPKFVPAEGSFRTNLQKEIVKEIFVKNTDFSIINLKRPWSCFYFYSLYFEELDSEKRYTKKFDELLNLSSSKFYYYLLNFLSNETTSYGKTIKTEKYLNLRSISYNEEFKDKVIKKIATLSQSEQDVIKQMIDRGKKWQ